MLIGCKADFNQAMKKASPNWSDDQVYSIYRKGYRYVAEVQGIIQIHPA